MFSSAAETQHTDVTSPGLTTSESSQGKTLTVFNFDTQPAERSLSWTVPQFSGKASISWYLQWLKYLLNDSSWKILENLTQVREHLNGHQLIDSKHL